MQQEPEMRDLSEFLNEFNKESDRGAALNAAAVLDDWLENILRSFFADNKSGKELISGFNAPLGKFAAAFLINYLFETRSQLIIEPINESIGFWVKVAEFFGDRVCYEGIDYPKGVWKKYNKRFKTDSQRSAVLVRFGFFVYGAITECCGSVAHHLSGRYIWVRVWK